MAQRSFLIPVSIELKELFLKLIETSEDSPIWERIYELSSQHRKVLFYSKNFSEFVNQKKVEEKNMDLLFGMFLNMRPYLITEKEISKAVEITDSLLKCEEEQDIVNVFTQQCNKIYDFLNVDETNVQIYEDDITVFDNIKKQIKILKDYRDGFYNKKNVFIEIPKQTQTELGIEVSLSGEMELKEINYREIPKNYGDLIGQTFGELCGLCYPSWWLGRNYWFGLLMKGELGTLGQIPYIGLRRLIKTKSEIPTTLFESVGIPGFEKKFNIYSPSYQLGYYFPGESIFSVSYALKSKYQKRLHSLGKSITNYSDEDIKYCEQMIFESFEWAAKNKYGLIEGDDLVGWMGYR